MKLIDFKRYEIYDYNTQHMVLIECFSLIYHKDAYKFCVCHNVTMKILLKSLVNHCRTNSSRI
jgi:hypothetical protein